MDIAQMCDEYYPTVFGYLLSITGGNYDLAEELTQETFYRAIKNAKNFREDCKMSTWLCQIAKFTFYQHIDRKKRRKEVSMDTVTELEALQHLEQQFIEEEQKLEILKLIQKQAVPLRDVLMLRLLGNLSFQEIGEILGKNENWARVTFYRGKQIIGKELKKDGQKL